MKRVLFFALLLPLFMACKNEDEDFEQSYIEMGTIENSSQLTTFVFNQDDNTRLKITNSDIKYYRPKHGQRVIMEYVVLPYLGFASSYQYEVKMLDVYEILTKGIFNITNATQDSIGNDALGIRDIWVSNDYLNIDFVYPGYSKMHFISLVKDASKTYTDGKVHLELRHNANDDYPSVYMNGLVSFNLSTLRVNGSNSVDFVLHTKEFNHEDGERTHNITYKYGISATLSPAKVIAIPERKAIVK